MTFEFPDDLEQLINQQMSTGNFQSPEQLLRTALQEFVQRSNYSPNEGDGTTNGNALDALQKQGLVGSIRSGHTDLSTNSKHMEGFGRNGS